MRLPGHQVLKAHGMHHALPVLVDEVIYYVVDSMTYDRTGVDRITPIRHAAILRPRSIWPVAPAVAPCHSLGRLCQARFVELLKRSHGDLHHTAHLRLPRHRLCPFGDVIYYLAKIRW